MDLAAREREFLAVRYNHSGTTKTFAAPSASGDRVSVGVMRLDLLSAQSIKGFKEGFSFCHFKPVNLPKLVG